MKIAAALVLVMVVAGFAIARGGQADAPPLALKLNIHGDVAHLILINQGDEPITILSQAMDRSADRNPERAGEAWDGALVLTLSLGTANMRWNGHPVVGSKYAHLPVVLHPGEATLYKFADSHRIPPRYLDAEVKSIEVVYEVPAEYGDRWSIWSGKAASNVHEVRDGVIQPFDD